MSKFELQNNIQENEYTSLERPPNYDNSGFIGQTPQGNSGQINQGFNGQPAQGNFGPPNQAFNGPPFQGNVGQPFQGNVGQPNQIFYPTMIQPGLTNNQVVFGNSTRVNPDVNFDVAITLSCFVFFLFNFVFGGIAFILAIVGYATNRPENEKQTSCMQRASYIVSFVGLLVSIFVWLVVITNFAYFATIRRDYYNTDYSGK